MSNSKSLIDILKNHNINGFDKEGGTDKHSGHSYIEVYGNILHQYIDRKINLIEVGIQYGGSCLLWQEYFKFANFYFIDNVDVMGNNIKSKLDYNRCKIYKMDAYTNHAIDILKKDAPEGYHIIIDDGPHTINSQVLFIKKYLKILNDDGILIIEDVDFKNIQLLKNQIPSEYKTDIIDLRKIKNVYDDVMLIVKKSN